MNYNNKYFLDTFCNFNSLKTVVLTFDIDWAPDYMIQRVIDTLSEFNVSATFFVTHFSELLKNETEKNSKFEIGLHPYVDKRSSQGNDLEKIIFDLKSFYPNKNISGNRFHILKHSYRDLIKLGEKKIKYDISTLRFNSPYLLPCYHKDLNMYLLSYFWEDGVCENSFIPLKLKNFDVSSPGLKIFNFHPLNIYINGENSQQRIKFLKENPDLINCKKEIAEMYKLNGSGAFEFLLELLNYCKDNNVNIISAGQLISNIQNVFRNE